MKQHITSEQLNELSDKGKEKLRKWWKPEEGDWFATRYSALYYCYGGREVSDTYSEYLLTDQAVDSGYNGWSLGESFPEGTELGGYYQERGEEILADALPLLSIGQMIELLEDIMPEGVGLHDIMRRNAGWGLLIYRDDSYEHSDVVTKFGKNEITSTTNWRDGLSVQSYHTELADALWEATKEVLEDTGKTVEELKS